MFKGKYIMCALFFVFLLKEAVECGKEVKYFLVSSPSLRIYFGIHRCHIALGLILHRQATK
jgi:hypothetical protein